MSALMQRDVVSIGGQESGAAQVPPESAACVKEPAAPPLTGHGTISVAEPILGAAERAALLRVLDDGWITMGAEVHAFERAFAERHGLDDAVAVNSCTAALHLLLEAHGIGPGDEVLIPSLTFVATANAVLYAGAKPVFVDIVSLEDPLISIEDAEAKRTARTRAVMLMHYGGVLARRGPWRGFAARHGLLLLEDSAHAVGIDGPGSFGDGAAFSFYGNKNMTTAEGGMVVARDPDVLARARQMRGHGLTSGTFERHRTGSPQYDVTMRGYNYRMDNLRAAIGLAQLAQLDEWNGRRKALATIYAEAIRRHCPEIMVQWPGDEASAHHIMPVVLPADVDRESVIAALRDDGVQTTIHYPPVHRLTVYRDLQPGVALPVTEEFCGRELTLPLHPRMNAAQVEYIVDRLARAAGRLKKM